jgi:phospholipid/cholesterol/gamma-HCH transport system permease protein
MRRHYGVREKIVQGITEIGSFCILLARAFSWGLSFPIEADNIIYHLYNVGFNSFPIIFLTSFSLGMVLALQSGITSKIVFNEPLYVGTIVGFSLLKELAPLITSVVIIGRVGASFAAEIGTMKVTEQIDALYTLGSNPIKYLVVPRVIGCTLMVPLLTIVSNVAGILGGMFISYINLDIPANIYISDTFDFLRVRDFLHGLIKALIFGFLVANICCYKGLRCEGGAEGVGKATTSAVVTSLVVILLADYFLTRILVMLKIG